MPLGRKKHHIFIQHNEQHLSVHKQKPKKYHGVRHDAYYYCYVCLKPIVKWAQNFSEHTRKNITKSDITHTTTVISDLDQLAIRCNIYCNDADIATETANGSTWSLSGGKIGQQLGKQFKPRKTAKKLNSSFHLSFSRKVTSNVKSV